MLGRLRHLIPAMTGYFGGRRCHGLGRFRLLASDRSCPVAISQCARTYRDFERHSHQHTNAATSAAAVASCVYGFTAGCPHANQRS